MDGDVVTTRRWRASVPVESAVVSAVSSVGRPTLHTSADPDAHGDTHHWGPLELLAASLSGCLFHAALDVARRSRVALVGWSDTVTLTVGPTPNGRRKVLSVRVTVEAEVDAGTSVDRARRILEKAHALCVVARSLDAPVEVEVDVQAAPSQRPGQG